MSLIPPFLRAQRPITAPDLAEPLARFGIRGLPSLDVEANIKAVVDLATLRQDVAYATQPLFFAGLGRQLAVAAQFTDVNFQAIAPVTIVDRVDVSSIGAAAEVELFLLPQQTIGAGTQVWATNRPAAASSRGQGIISSSTQIGQQPAANRIGGWGIPITFVSIPLGWRLNKSDALVFEVAVVNQGLIVTWWGREFRE